MFNFLLLFSQQWNTHAETAQLCKPFCRVTYGHGYTFGFVSLQLSISDKGETQYILVCVLSALTPNQGQRQLCPPCWPVGRASAGHSSRMVGGAAKGAGGRGLGSAHTL